MFFYTVYFFLIFCGNPLSSRCALIFKIWSGLNYSKSLFVSHSCWVKTRLPIMGRIHVCFHYELSADLLCLLRPWQRLLVTEFTRIFFSYRGYKCTTLFVFQFAAVSVDCTSARVLCSHPLFRSECLTLCTFSWCAEDTWSCTIVDEELLSCCPSPLRISEVMQPFRHWAPISRLMLLYPHNTAILARCILIHHLWFPLHTCQHV